MNRRTFMKWTGISALASLLPVPVSALAYKGKAPMDAGLIYAPYVPVTITGDLKVQGTTTVIDTEEKLLDVFGQPPEGTLSWDGNEWGIFNQSHPVRYELDTPFDIGSARPMKD